MNGLVGGLGVFIYAVLFFALLTITTGLNVDKLGFSLNDIVFSHLLSNYPLLWMCVLFLIVFVAGFSFATFGLGFSVLLRNTYLTVLFTPTCRQYSVYHRGKIPHQKPSK